jgi:hypothetical protein
VVGRPRLARKPLGSVTFATPRLGRRVGPRPYRRNGMRARRPRFLRFARSRLRPLTCRRRARLASPRASRSRPVRLAAYEPELRGLLGPCAGVGGHERGSGSSARLQGTGSAPACAGRPRRQSAERVSGPHEFPSSRKVQPVRELLRANERAGLRVSLPRSKPRLLRIRVREQASGSGRSGCDPEHPEGLPKNPRMIGAAPQYHHAFDTADFGRHWPGLGKCSGMKLL